MDLMDPAVANVDLPARETFNVWLERMFPDDVRRRRYDDGYTATGNNTGPSPRREDDDVARAQLRYFTATCSRRLVRDKLQAAAVALDALGMKYAWYVGRGNYPYLLVERYCPEEAASELAEVATDLFDEVDTNLPHSG